MSPDVMNNGALEPTTELKGQVAVQPETQASTTQTITPVFSVAPKSWETMYVKTVDANVQGVSLLDVGHAQIDNLRLNISDTSGIILSGGSLRKFKR